ncbi:MAG: TAT-variant-translocated molybdopterin oxidoreductase [Flavobacteriales bacterium]|jgi:molybdopterin-containing oxidoreductase family iron-sulfur binding subunit|nr:TAT-variant-translocated molybdopterin oxidoreductase [Flavobacteriales bacterium]
MASKKIYYSSIQELEKHPAIEEIQSREFQESPEETTEKVEESSTSRRDFLKFVGFSTAAATIASCEAPVYKAIPYVVKPEEVVAGEANWYASTYFDGHDYASVLVKNREGRPIFLKANPDAAYGKGLSARVMGSLLSLYDSGRVINPMKGGEDSNWETVDKEISSKLKALSADKRMVLMTSTIISPSIKAVIEKYKTTYTNFSHVTYDAVSYSAMLDANKEMFGKRVLPTYKFDKADIIVSFGADFIQDWTENEFGADYAKGRNPESGRMNKHYQFEANMSLTGSNADYRFPIKPSQEGLLLLNLYNMLAQKAGAQTYSSKKSNLDEQLKTVANELWVAKGKSLVVSGSSDKNIQMVVNKINELIASYGSTIDMDNVSFQRQGNDADVAQLIKDMNAGKVGALMLHNVNPAYTLPSSLKFADAIKKVALTVSFTLKENETTALCEYITPDNHLFESWGDAQPTKNYIGLIQPTISPLFDTRQWNVSLLKWLGEETDAYTALKTYWDTNLLNGQSWNQCLHDGFLADTKAAAVLPTEEAPVVAAETETPETATSSAVDFMAIANAIKANAGKASGLEMTLYTKSGIGNGSHADNPWLQELPDPISKATWDNYLTVNASDAKEWGLENEMQSNGSINGAYVTLSNGSTTIEKVPVLVQPGQARGTVGLAVGYGRTHAGKEVFNFGINAYELYNNFSLTSDNFKIEKTSGASGGHEFALTQVASTAMDRSEIIKETTFAEFQKDPTAGTDHIFLDTHKGKKHVEKVTLWQEFERDVHFWNLSIDLTKCNGCAACVVACHAENNVPVVGKEEIRVGREMHWLRIDRYYSSDTTKENANTDGLMDVIDMYLDMEIPSETPQVVFQPTMCQHCNHAPCENVCPVAATSHSREGLNHMAYNRCIGTRYCANNCPYKVRRFNWFQYSQNDDFDFVMNDEYSRMVLNPDVVVRSRGVIEKCSMCVHMIQKTKLDAKKAGRQVKDHEAQTACTLACDTGAMVFGDSMNKDHEVAELKESPRAYHSLEQLNTQPSVWYQTKVRNL